MSFYTGRFYREILLLHDNDQSPIEKDSIESYILRNSSIGWYLIIVLSILSVFPTIVFVGNLMNYL